MLAGTPTPKPKAKSAEAAGVALTWFSPPHHPATMFMRNSNTKRYKSGNPALLSVHFADAVSPEKSNWLMRAEKKSASSRP
ncbi:MAG: hypothetical protein WB689_13540 [Xanthobacteraceae bacterium]